MNATILSGESLSSTIDLNPLIQSGAPRAVRINMPDAWTTAKLMALISDDFGETFRPLVDGAGDLILMDAAADTTIALDMNYFGYIACFQLQSVNGSGTPVNQGAVRTLEVIISTPF